MDPTSLPWHQVSGLLSCSASSRPLIFFPGFCLAPWGRHWQRAPSGPLPGFPPLCLLPPPQTAGLRLSSLCAPPEGLCQPFRASTLSASASDPSGTGPPSLGQPDQSGGLPYSLQGSWPCTEPQPLGRPLKKEENALEFPLSVGALAGA